MKLYLFGGAETDQGQAPRLKELIKQVIADVNPRQVLHIPYARIDVPKDERDIWGDGWVKKDLSIEGIEFLDARNEKDLAKAEKPLIFINGGFQKENLYKEITSNKKLYNFVMNAEYLIGESAGSMICAEFRRTLIDGETIVTKGLGILKNTIIEAHYTQRKRQALLRKEMKETSARFGIGIDSLNAAVIDTETFPDVCETIGSGLVEVAVD